MMALLKLQFVLCIWMCLYDFILSSVNGINHGTVLINGSNHIGRIDEDFICATLDWWPPDKTDHGITSWGDASVLNLDLDNVILMKAVKAFSPLKLRIGGGMQNDLIYQTKDSKQPCNPFVKNSSAIYGYNQGCLPLARWDKLNHFFKKSGVKATFGLSVLSGRKFSHNGSVIGKWDSTNAESLIKYTANNGYFNIIGWELGNELTGMGSVVEITPDQYAKDTANLQNKVKEIYKDSGYKPLIVAPAGNFDPDWYRNFVFKANDSLDVVTHHIYNLGEGGDEDLVEKILDPSYLNRVASVYFNLRSILKNANTLAKAWVGEGGGVYGSGRNGVTNTFLFSFWYLDQLGMASSFDTKTYCRQSLIGGFYGLLNTTTFVPNQDYYSALLFHRLMGRNVLWTNFTGTKMIRSYAHCAKKSAGVTLLLINLDGNNTIQVEVTYINGGVYKHEEHHHRRSKRVIQMPRGIMELGTTTREEYHLSAKNGDIHSQGMMLNGNELTVDAYGNIPPLEPVTVNSDELINVAPFSIVFVHMPSVILDACK